MPKNPLSRRQFLAQGAAAGAFMVVPRRVVAGAAEAAPSERLQVAGIGAGGQAMADLGQVSQFADIVALCDVDQERAARAYERWPDARRYTDYRVMLEKEQQQIDAVVIASPDHTHAVAAMAAMQLGKHVYVEKPMSHNIAETRELMRVARETGVVTQMGNQGHSFPGVYRIRRWVDLGAVGPITEVHCWTNRPRWPQGIDRPTETPPVPETLDWDLWLGPAAHRPYHPAYCPRDWRGWWDFGTAALGDMGCHILDPPFYALQLGAPARVTAEEEGATSETGPLRSKIVFEFPERGEGLPACTLTWYDGDQTPPRPEGIGEDEQLGDSDGGSLFLGAKSQIVSGTYSNNARILDEALAEEFEPSRREEYRSMGHHHNWVAACKGEEETVSHFDYAGPLTELVHLGNLAIRAGGPIEWDAANMRVTNLPEANEFVSREYRDGWR